MTAATDPVALLERAIAYTRGTLCGVSEDPAGRPTPCAEWDLEKLLRHMSDALDAFTEASRGVIDVAPTRRHGPPVAVLRDQACTLLGAWSSPAAAEARLGDTRLGSTTLLGAAALEIAVHGWDVGQATGRPVALPEALAEALLPVARALVDDTDRGVRFGPRVAVTARPGAAGELLGFLGREPLPSHLSRPQQGD